MGRWLLATGEKWLQVWYGVRALTARFKGECHHLTTCFSSAGEEKYRWSKYIAEPVNTFTNLFFLLMSIYGAKKCHDEQLPFRFILVNLVSVHLTFEDYLRKPEDWSSSCRARPVSVSAHFYFMPLWNMKHNSSMSFQWFILQREYHCLFTHISSKAKRKWDSILVEIVSWHTVY